MTSSSLSGISGRRLFGRAGAVVQDRRRHFCAGLAAERPLPGCHLVQHESERKQIGAGVDRATAELFRRHVRQRAERRSRPGQRRVDRARLVVMIAVGFRQTEVENLDRALFGQEDVGWLQVAMDDAARVSSLEAIGEGDRVIEQCADGERTRAEHLVQRRAGQQLHHQIRMPRIGADIEQRADVRVIERGDRAPLTLESRAVRPTPTRSRRGVP